MFMATFLMFGKYSAEGVQRDQLVKRTNARHGRSIADTIKAIWNALLDMMNRSACHNRRNI